MARVITAKSRTDPAVGAPRLTPGAGFKLQPSGQWKAEEIPQGVLKDAKVSGVLVIEGFRCVVFEMPDGEMWAQKDSSHRASNVSPFTWISPDLSEEKGDLQRVALQEHLEPGALLRQAQSASILPLSDKDWQRLEGTSSFDVGTLDSAASLVETYGRDFERIVRGMNSGAEIPTPIVLERQDGSIVLVSGDARLMAARASGIVPEVLWVRAPDALINMATRLASRPTANGWPASPCRLSAAGD